jgi:hypothetical protein
VIGFTNEDLNIAVQASKVEQEKLNKWIKESNITFPLGLIEGDEEQTRSTWGVRSHELQNVRTHRKFTSVRS